MSVASSVDTVVVGAGQAGLAMSRLLRQAGRDHVVLERRARLGGGWQDRWDNFRLVTPNWTASLPGFPYDGPDPDAFMGRDEIVVRVARYGEHVQAPVHLETDVNRLTARPEGGSRSTRPPALSTPARSLSPPAATTRRAFPS